MTAREVIRTLERLGFAVRRQVGSHVRLVHHERPQAGVTREEFERARRKRA